MKSDNNQDAVKKCPFCLGQAETNYALHDRNAWSVDCEECDASKGYFSTSKEAIAAWNTRVESKEPVSPVAEEKPLLELYCPDCKRKLESFYDFEKGHEVYFCNDSCESGYRGHFGSDLKKIRQPVEEKTYFNSHGPVIKESLTTDPEMKPAVTAMYQELVEAHAKIKADAVEIERLKKVVDTQYSELATSYRYSQSIESQIEKAREALK